eukprot:jgi/Bigna1/137764/aug1.41_g12472
MMSPKASFKDNLGHFKKSKIYGKTIGELTRDGNLNPVPGSRVIQLARAGRGHLRRRFVQFLGLGVLSYGYYKGLNSVLAKELATISAASEIYDHTDKVNHQRRKKEEEASSGGGSDAEYPVSNIVIRVIKGATHLGLIAAGYLTYSIDTGTD